ncbi:MAG: alpha-L-fucosidase [Pseudomonadales bacterium]
MNDADPSSAADHRLSWFDDARLGLFVHWGHYAAAGWEASWPLVGGVVTLPHGQILSVEKYHANAHAFRPDRDAPGEWIAAAASAGMRYAVMTTRHHDGFSMWPTRHSDYHIGLGGYPGDPVREYVDACRAHGLKIGFYYSLPDWHHPDYPAFTDAAKPYVFGQYPAATKAQWSRYLNYVRAQLTELLTDYGPIDLLWFDGGWERNAETWDSEGLERLIHRLQPDVLINDRLPEHGDYATPEQFIPPTPPEGRWETCLTMNESWGFNPDDQHYKSSTSLIHTLCEVVGRGGNLLLNVSPDGGGHLIKPQLERLRALARWTVAHGDAVYGTRAGLEPWQFYGPSTRRDNTVYLHLLMKPIGPVTLRGIPVKHILGVRNLATGRTLDYASRIPVFDMLMGTDGPGEISIEVPATELDPDATVIAVEFDQVV